MPLGRPVDCIRHTVLTLDGEIDLAAAPSVRASLAAIVQDELARDVVIDLRDVTFMDSTGVGALLSAYRHLKLQQRTLVLAQPQPIVARVLGITNVARLFPVVDSVDIAIDNCSGVHATLAPVPL